MSSSALDALLSFARRAFGADRIDVDHDDAGEVKLRFVWGSERRTLDEEAVAELLLAVRQVTEDARAVASELARSRVMVEQLDAGVLVEDERRHIRYANTRFCELHGLAAPPSALEGVDCSDAAERNKADYVDPDGFVARIHELLAAGRTCRGELVRRVDGRTFERDYVPVRGEGGDLGHMWVYRDVTDRVHHEHALVAASHRDELTGLVNRRGLTAAVRSWPPDGGPVSLLYVDLDDLKVINDGLGHAAGDDAIRAVAATLRAVVRATDVVARLGGDEFVVALPACEESAARRLASRVHAALPAPLSASIGLVTVPRADFRLDEVIEHADRSMYDDKRRKKTPGPA